MPLDIVVGTQWGDEGKGRITDLLAAQAAIVARAAGGDNAGHTVTVGAQRFRLHLIPSGITQPRAVCVLASGMVINPEMLVAEIDSLAALGLDTSPRRVRLSTEAHIITPAHIALDASAEDAHPSGGLGTTRRGIGPAYADKAARRGLRAGAMRDPEAFARQVEEHVGRAQSALPAATQGQNPQQVGRRYGELAERLRPYLGDTGALVFDALESGHTVLAEGAQGTLLDLDHGTYPFVTSSHPSAPGALLGLGVGARHLRRVLGVTKAFQTRVGAGPFPTEVHGEAADRLRGSGENPWDEFGTTTGRARRCGWLDGVLLRYAARLNGLTELALTKLDILSGIAPVPLCTAYQMGETARALPPEDLARLGECAPIYEELPGWRGDLGEARRWEGLPPSAQAYVARLETLTDLPVRLISVGPEREQVIDREARP